MEGFLELIRNPFVWGLAIGLFFFVLAAFKWLKTQKEFSRYKRMLSDKMELEAEQASKLKAQREELAKENENMRLKLGQLSEKPDARIERELEILARAEKAMMINAPGFAGAWETAKTAAAEEVAEEASGKSIPKRIFRKFFGGAVKDVEAISMDETQEG